MNNKYDLKLNIVIENDLGCDAYQIELNKDNQEEVLKNKVIDNILEKNVDKLIKAIIDTTNLKQLRKNECDTLVTNSLELKITRYHVQRDNRQKTQEKIEETNNNKQSPIGFRIPKDKPK